MADRDVLEPIEQRRRMLRACKCARESVDWWRDCLGTAVPVAGADVIEILNSEKVRETVWAWLNVGIIAALLCAMWLIYRKLRNERDAFEEDLEARNDV